MNISKIARSIGGVELTALLINVVGFLTLGFKVLFSPHRLIYDEVYHLPLVELLNREGLSYTFLRGTKESAPGPLYALVHYFFQPFTNLQPPAIRLVNIFLLLLIIIVLNVIFQRIFKIKNAWPASFVVMSLPMIWTISGMALTEIPAMFFAILSILLLFISLDTIGINPKSALCLGAIGGLCMGGAIIGRQTYLVMLFALPLLTVYSPKLSWKVIGLFFIGSLILPSIVFSVWGGLIPPGQQVVSQGYSLVNGFLSFAYAGLLFLALAPGWFNLKLEVILSVVLGSYFINSFFQLIYIAPARYALAKIIPQSLLLGFNWLFSSFLFSIGILFIIASIKNIQNNLKDNKFIFLTFIVFLICATSFKITHYYSTRYTATAIPFMILLFSYYPFKNKFKILIILLGNIAGFMMLNSYFLRTWS